MRQIVADSRRRTGRYRPRQANMNTAVNENAAASVSSQFSGSRLDEPTRFGVRVEARTTARKQSVTSKNNDDSGTLRNAANMESPPSPLGTGGRSGSAVPHRVSTLLIQRKQDVL